MIYSWSNPDWIQGSKNFHGVRDQDLQQFWDQGSKFNVEMWDQVGENITRYDPGISYGAGRRTTSRDFVARGRPLCGQNRLAPLGKRSTCSKSRSYELYAHVIYFIRGLHRKKKCFKMERVLPLFLYGTKSRENIGPNGQPAQCMTPSGFYSGAPRAREARAEWSNMGKKIW